MPLIYYSQGSNNSWDAGGQDTRMNIYVDAFLDVLGLREREKSCLVQVQVSIGPRNWLHPKIMKVVLPSSGPAQSTLPPSETSYIKRSHIQLP